MQSDIGHQPEAQRNWHERLVLAATVFTGICLPSLLGCSEAPPQEPPPVAAQKQEEGPATQNPAHEHKHVTYSEEQAAEQKKLDDISTKLANEGLTGLMHGARPERGLYVFVYHTPGNFFERHYISVIPSKKEHRELLATLDHGDRVHVKGELIAVDTAQPHLRLSEIKLEKAWEPNIVAPAGEFHPEAALPQELKNKHEINAMVHAVRGEGTIVVLEYKDAIVPMVVEEPSFTKDLFRGDRIKVQFELQGSPGRPTHISLDTDTKDGKNPVEVLDSINSLHDKIITMEGQLVLFPASPTINRDVWAVENKGGDGTARYFTLVNFEQDANEEFSNLEKIGEKLQAAWSAHPDTIFHGRNKYINTGITVKATGRVSIADPGQANAQIHLTADAIEVQ